MKHSWNLRIGKYVSSWGPFTLFGRVNLTSFTTRFKPDMFVIMSGLYIGEFWFIGKVKFEGKDKGWTDDKMFEDEKRRTLRINDDDL